MGVGGSFDVLSGKKQRAPALFVKTNTEWLYRILREPSRAGKILSKQHQISGRGAKSRRKIKNCRKTVFSLVK